MVSKDKRNNRKIKSKSPREKKVSLTKKVLEYLKMPPQSQKPDEESEVESSY